MKRVVFLSIVICVLVSSCGKRIEADESLSNPYVELSTQIQGLNQNYITPGTKARWWKYLITAVADAGVGLATGRIDYAISASSLTWTMLKDLSDNSGSSSTAPELGDRNTSIYDVDVSLTNLDVYEEEGLSDGEIHNIVINNIYNVYGEAMFELESEELLVLVANEVASLTNSNPSSVISDIDRACSEVSVYTNAYLRSSSVDDYIAELKAIHPDKADELDVLKAALEGFQFIDPETDDGQYARDVVNLIEDSDIDDASKNTLTSSVSIANASVRLWNNDAINE